MKNFKLFPSLKEYRHFIYSEIFTASEFREDPFYQSLIEFVIQHRAPIFFEQNEDFEFSHFTQYFNFVLDRKNYYKNDFVRSMYFAHDFVHMLFRNPLRVKHLSFQEFCEIMNHNEWVASNETETLTYYRLPGSRAKSLPYAILYDVLSAAGQSAQPTAKMLLDLRKDILFEMDTTGIVQNLEQQEGAAEVLAYLRKFKENNKAWCQLWYDNFPQLFHAHEGFPYEDEPVTAPLTEYEMFLKNFNPNGFYNTQENYERNVVRNVRNLVLLTGSHVSQPVTLQDCEVVLQKMEGVVVMRDAAERFHETYIKNKKVGTGAAKETLVKSNT